MTSPKVGKNTQTRRGSKPGELRGNAGKGRPKGVPNKVTAGTKAAIEAAFQGIGGVQALQKWAKDNPEAFYTKVWVRILPQDINAKVAARTMTPEEADAIVDEALGLNG